MLSAVTRLKSWFGLPVYAGGSKNYVLENATKLSPFGEQPISLGNKQLIMFSR
jgi:hypothetical protein